MTLGGRAAEELVFDEITTGAANDLEKVTSTAKQMTMRFGMSEKLGPRVLGHNHGAPFLGRDMHSEPDYSDDLARTIDSEIRRIIEEAHQRARDILVEHRDDLEILSQILLRARDDRARGVPRPPGGRDEAEVFAARDASARRAGSRGRDRERPRQAKQKRMPYPGAGEPRGRGLTSAGAHPRARGHSVGAEAGRVTGLASRHARDPPPRPGAGAAAGRAAPRARAFCAGLCLPLRGSGRRRRGRWSAWRRRRGAGRRWRGPGGPARRSRSSRWRWAPAGMGVGLGPPRGHRAAARSTCRRGRAGRWSWTRPPAPDGCGGLRARAVADDLRLAGGRAAAAAGPGCCSTCAPTRRPPALGARLRVRGWLRRRRCRPRPGWWRAWLARQGIAGAHPARAPSRRGAGAAAWQGLRDRWRAWAAAHAGAGLAGDRAALVRGMALGGGAGCRSRRPRRSATRACGTCWPSRART